MNCICEIMFNYDTFLQSLASEIDNEPEFVINQKTTFFHLLKRLNREVNKPYNNPVEVVHAISSLKPDFDYYRLQFQALSRTSSQELKPLYICLSAYVDQLFLLKSNYYSQQHLVDTAMNLGDLMGTTFLRLEDRLVSLSQKMPDSQPSLLSLYE
ncbi:MAG: hypothetical protein ACMXYG_04415 [Candidatus Woesearchaeota archaeon]